MTCRHIRISFLLTTKSNCHMLLFADEMGLGGSLKLTADLSDLEHLLEGFLGARDLEVRSSSASGTPCVRPEAAQSERPESERPEAAARERATCGGGHTHKALPPRDPRDPTTQVQSR